MSKPVFAFGLATILAIIVALTGVTASLGAHHFWSSQVVFIGLAIGMGLFAVSLVLTKTGQLTAGVFLIGGILAARFGKKVFVESFAENALAGQFWYFGWIVLCAGAIALIAISFMAFLTRRGQG